MTKAQNQPLITVVTVVYNDTTHIEQTMLSVLNQTYPSIEYIIIDGGSTDGTVNIIKKYADRLAYWVSESDKGIYDAMNKGIDKAKGLYCIFINSGDLFYSKNTVIDTLKNKLDADIISGTAELSNGTLWEAPSESRLSLMFFYNYGLCHQATYILTGLLKKIMYDENLKIASDSKFFIEALILQNASYSKINTLVCKYQLGGISSNQQQQKKDILQIFNEFFPSRIVKDYVTYSKYGNKNYSKILNVFDVFFYGLIEPLIFTLIKIRNFWRSQR